MDYIPQVNGTPYVNNAEFVKLTLVRADHDPDEIYTFSSSYKQETFNSTTFTPLGGLLNVSTQQRDLRVTSYDTTISLLGVDPTNIYVVLSSDFLIKGSKIELWRGFYDDNYILTNTVLRYTGIITSYTVQETVDMDSMSDSYIIALNCSNYKTVLENRIAGRNTNSSSWKEFNPTDTSMDSVAGLVNAVFDFGVPATNQGQNTTE